MESLLLSGSIYLTKLSQRKVDDIMKCNRNTPLLDIVHTNSPNLSNYEKYIDLLPSLLGLIVVILVFKKRLHFPHICKALALIFILRCIAFSCTILPSPLNKSTSPNAIGGFHDCVFSGHTATMLIFAYYIQTCTKDFNKLLFAYCILSSLIIIMTRSHYTVDVFVAWIVVYAVIKYIES